MKIQIAALIDDSIVDGDGYRFTVFVQGCRKEIKCPGCHNPSSWDPAGGTETDTADILAQILDNGLLAGVTFSGGEPFDQPEPLTELAQSVHAHGLDVWCYSGYTYEELLARNDSATDALLANIDVLVDGRYVEAQRDLTLEFRGSRNQRIIDMAATRESGKIVER